VKELHFSGEGADTGKGGGSPGSVVEQWRGRSDGDHLVESAAERNWLGLGSVKRSRYPTWAPHPCRNQALVESASPNRDRRVRAGASALHRWDPY
jgi:hypothetical protein